MAHPHPAEPEPVDAIRRYAGFGFVIAMVLAPFLALILGIGIGLLVMTIALTATTVLVIDARRMAERERQTGLAVLAAVNAVLALTCLLGAISRLR